MPRIRRLQPRLVGVERATAGLLEPPEGEREVARQRERVLDRRRQPDAAEAIRLQLRQVEQQPVGAREAAHRRRHVVEPDDVDLAVLLEGERALGQPGGARAELDVALHRPLRERRELVPQVDVQEALALEAVERARELELRRGDLLARSARS